MKKLIILSILMVIWDCINSFGQKSSLEVTLYEDSNFTGQNVRLGIGKFDLAQYQFYNKLSSIRIPAGLVVKIKGGNKGWRSLWVDLDNFEAIKFHDVATEIEVFGPYAILVKNRNFMKEGTDILCLPEGIHAIPDAINEIDQFRGAEVVLVPKGYRVVLNDGNGVNLSSESKIEFEDIRKKSLNGRISLINFMNLGPASYRNDALYSDKAAYSVSKIDTDADKMKNEETDEQKPPVDNKLILNQEAINAFVSEAGNSKTLRFIADTIELVEPIKLTEKRAEFFCNYLFCQKGASLKIDVQEGKPGGNVIAYCKKINELPVNLTGGQGAAGKQLRPHRLQGNILSAIVSFPHWANSMKGEPAGDGGTISIYTVNHPAIKVQLDGGRGGRGASSSYVLAEEQIPKLILKFRGKEFGGIYAQNLPIKGLVQESNQWNNCYVKVPVPAGVSGKNGRPGKPIIKMLTNQEFEEIASKAMGGIEWTSLKKRAYRWEYF